MEGRKIQTKYFLIRGFHSSLVSIICKSSSQYSGKCSLIYLCLFVYHK
jgi:hypothetical protein